jgi:hypothetical protein
MNSGDPAGATGRVEAQQVRWFCQGTQKRQAFDEQNALFEKHLIWSKKKQTNQQEGKQEASKSRWKRR